jgi:hypothetical protein
MQTDPNLQLLAEKAGIHFAYDMTLDAKMGLDAQASIITTPNSAVPVMLTSYIDPKVLEVRVSPMKAAQILGEEKVGDWTMEVAMFPVAERAGEVTSYGDYNNDGIVSSNFQFPQRQNYRYQTVIQYGDLEVEKVALAKINWISQLQASRALAMGKFENRSYFFGVQGLQNYGLLNDPALPAALTPGTKAAGNGNVWVYNGTPNATALEVYADVQKMYLQLVAQSAGVVDGLVDAESEMILCMHPTTSIALTQLVPLTGTSSVIDLLKKTFPKLRVETAVEYSTAAGYEVQLIAPSVEGQQTGYAAFSEKMRSHRIIPDMSSFKQKVSGGVWGAVLRQPWAIASMLGV